jgi:hypothetical protein
MRNEEEDEEDVVFISYCFRQSQHEHCSGYGQLYFLKAGLDQI